MNDYFINRISEARCKFEATTGQNPTHVILPMSDAFEMRDPYNRTLIYGMQIIFGMVHNPICCIIPEVKIVDKKDMNEAIGVLKERRDSLNKAIESLSVDVFLKEK